MAFRFISFDELPRPRQLVSGRAFLDQVGMTMLESYFPQVGSPNTARELRHNWMWMTIDLPGTSLSKAYLHEDRLIPLCLAAGPDCVRTEFALSLCHDVRWCIVGLPVEGLIGNTHKRTPDASI